VLEQTDLLSGMSCAPACRRRGRHAGYRRADAGGLPTSITERGCTRHDNHRFTGGHRCEYWSDVGPEVERQKHIGSEKMLRRGGDRVLRTLSARMLHIGRCGGGVGTTPARYPQDTPGRKRRQSQPFPGHHV